MHYLAISAVVAVTACGNVGTVISDYGPVKPIVVAHNDMNWKIYDIPAENRMMVAPTVASVASAGKNGQRNMLDDPEAFQSAAQAALAPRGCTADSVKPLVKSQMEISYSC